MHRKVVKHNLKNNRGRMLFLEKDRRRDSFSESFTLRQENHDSSKENYFKDSKNDFEDEQSNLMNS